MQKGRVDKSAGRFTTQNESGLEITIHSFKTTSTELIRLMQEYTVNEYLTVDSKEVGATEIRSYPVSFQEFRTGEGLSVLGLYDSMPPGPTRIYFWADVKKDAVTFRCTEGETVNYIKGFADKMTRGPATPYRAERTASSSSTT